MRRGPARGQRTPVRHRQGLHERIQPDRCLDDDRWDREMKRKVAAKLTGTGGLGPRAPGGAR